MWLEDLTGLSLEGYVFFSFSRFSHPPELSDHQNAQNFTPDSIFRTPEAANIQ